MKFVYTDENGAKQRPGLVISGHKYNQGRQEAILAAITSNVSRLLIGDYKIKAWSQAGLLFPSVITGIIRTVKKDMIVRKLGELPAPDLNVVEQQLRETLEI